MSTSELSAAEQEKATTLNAAIEGRITNGEAAKQLRLSIRQVQRAKAGIRKYGRDSVIHRLKGKTSNHSYETAQKKEILETIKQKYPDFKPGFATEKLQETQQIPMTSQTIRVWMKEAGLWKTRKPKKTGKHRSWRPRKDYYGELEQFDGSYHLWFENRFVDVQGTPIEVCLLASIDDATGKITKASFAANEGVVAVFTFWKGYILAVGKPLAVYLDKFSTYKINHKAAVDNHELMTQFERAMQDAAIELISAHSPQAKGRIERLFDTLQDRLVKELRLENINTPKEGNTFLENVFIPKFNTKFAVVPTKTGDVHRGLTETEKKNMHRIFAVQATRIVNNDFTIQFKNTWYQLAEIQPTTVRPKEKVLVEVWLDGTVHFSLREHYLSFLVLPERPKREKTNPPIITTHKLNHKPSATHPWRKLYKIKR